jgi:hypothetical protein
VALWTLTLLARRSTRDPQVSGAGAVTALVLLESTTGALAAAAWTQSWGIVRRGHFRIVAWIVTALAGVAAVAGAAAFPSGVAARALVYATTGATLVYLLAQRVRADVAGTVAGYAAAVLGAAALWATAALISGWPPWLAALELVAGAVLIGAVTNGMLLGHWYLNQPGLETWALGRLTVLALGAALSAGALGVAAARRLAGASTEGAVLGLPGFGESFGSYFFAVWLLLVAFTAIVVAMARRCVGLRSIQSATGLFYVAVLSAATAEFVVRYLMVNSGG